MDYKNLSTPPKCVADFCLIPIGTASASVSNEVASVQRLMKASELKYSMHSAGTTVEGSWDDVMRLIGQAHTLVHQNGVVRVQTDIRAGTRRQARIRKPRPPASGKARARKQEKDEGNSEDEDEGPQQEMNVVAPVVTAERAGGSPRLANRRQSLPNLDPSPEPSHNEAGSRSGGDSDDELNSTDSAEDDEKKPRPAKRKQLSSHDGPTRKKPRRPLQESSSRQRRPLSKPHRQYLKSHSPLDKCLRVVTSSSARGRLPSPAPSMPQSIDTKMSLGDSNLSLSSRATPPTLTEITFRPYSTHYYSFTATIRDGCDRRGVSLAQLARLIANTGHVGKIDDFTIKPIEQHSYLLSGFSRHTSSSTTAEVGRDHVDATRTRPQDGKAVDTGAFTSRRSEPSSSDDDESELSDSDSDPELGSDGDGDRCSSEDELGRSGTRMNVPWDPIDEQRFLAHKKESKSWKWIFRQFPGRTQPAVRTRLNTVQARGE